MAENNEQVSKEESQGANRKKRVPMMTVITILAVLVLQWGALGAVYLLFGGPDPATADTAVEDQQALLEKPVEEVVVEDRFQNRKSGNYIYDTQVVIVIQKKHQEDVKQMIETMHGQIQADIATIFRRAEPSHLHEPELSTIKRQIKAALIERIGYDQNGDPIVQAVAIPKCTEFPGGV